MWRLLTSEAHRTFFFVGAVQAIFALAWWTLEVAGRYAHLYAPYAWTFPSMWAHAWLLLYGLFPFFMFGFLMTAGPNWLGAPKMSRGDYLPAASCMAAGLVLFYIGLFAGRSLCAVGAFMHAFGWFWGVGALLRTAWRYRNANTRYAAVVFCFLTSGLLGTIVFAWSMATGEYGRAVRALHAGVWFFLLPVFLGVSTRMVPFFASRVLGPTVDYKPIWARPVLIAGVVLHGGMELAGAPELLWVLDLPLAAVLGHLVWRWGLLRSIAVRLLAVLHVSLAVLVIAFLLYGLSSLAVAAGAARTINLAPLHMVVLGYFSAMTLGMVSRVSLGHSGRKLEADALTWTCYIGLLVSAAIRAAAELLPPSAVGWVLVAAGATAFAAWLAWGSRYLPMYLTPRVDAPAP